MMKFKNWLRLDEMPHFSVSGDMTIPCPALIAAGLELPCVPGQQVGMIDMRFEFYPKGGFDWNKLIGYGAKFVAPIPGSSEYLVRDQKARLMIGSIAKESGILPEDETPGSISPQGYVLLPPDWLKYAILLDKEYNTIKQ